jgi:hypothetical protein
MEMRDNGGVKEERQDESGSPISWKSLLKHATPLGQPQPQGLQPRPHVSLFLFVSLPFIFTLFYTRLVLPCTSLLSLIGRLGPLTGSVRTATKRAGGSVRNHGGSPGKRLGVKKFSGMYFLPLLPQTC